MNVRLKEPWERGAVARGDGPRLNVRLSPEEWEALRKEARRRKAPISAVVRWAIYQALNQSQQGGA